MVADTAQTDVETLVARLAASGDAGVRARLLSETVDPRQAWEVAERLKAEADRARYQEAALALRWCGEAVTLGTQTARPTGVALGHMAEALLLCGQGRYRDSLALFDEAA